MSAFVEEEEIPPSIVASTPFSSLPPFHNRTRKCQLVIRLSWDTGDEMAPGRRGFREKRTVADTLLSGLASQARVGSKQR